MDGDFSIQNLFRLSMKRELPTLRMINPQPKRGEWLNIGAGFQVIPGFTNLDKPKWRWPRDPLPYGDDTVESILAFHFLEHLSGENAITMLLEIQRVLRRGGILTFCMPYYLSSMQGHDLTHKSFWNEDSFRTLFGNGYYDINGLQDQWKLRVHTLFLMGVVFRNLAIIGQLIKE